MAAYSQEQLDQLLGEAGGGRLVHSATVGKQKVPNPAYNKYDPSSRETIELDIQQWKSPEGHMIRAVQMPDGSWDVIQNEPPAPKPATSASAAIRNINGVPHQVVGKDANGQDIWAPVQTTTGPAQPSTPSSTTNPAATAGAISNITGTPTAYDGQGRPTAWDNSRPVRLWTRPDGTVIRADPLAGDERDRWEREKNAAAGLGAKTDAEIEKDKPQTGESRVPVEGRPGWTKVTRVKVEGGNKTEEVVYVGPDNQEVRTLPEQNQSGEVVKDVPNRPGWRSVTRVKVEGGNKTETTTYIGPDNQEVPTLPAEAGTVKTPVEGKPGVVKVTKKVGNDTETWYEDDKGNRVPTPTEGVGNLPSDFPRYTPDLTKRGQGLIEYQQAVDQWMAANPGKMTWEQRQKIMADAIGMAQVVTGEFNVAAGILREDYQSRITQRGQDQSVASSRLSAANAQVQQALGTIERLAPYLGASPGDAGKLFLGLQAAQMAHGVLMGGMRDVPRETMDPRLQAFADRAMPPVGAPGAAPPGAGAPVAGPPGAVPPNAPPAPGGPLAPATNTTDAGGVPRVFTPSSATGNALAAPPIFTPQPPAAFPGAPGNVAPGMMSPNPPDITELTPPVNPLPGQPGHDPNAPVGWLDPMGAPGPVNWAQFSVTQPSETPGQPGAPPMQPNVTRGSVFVPHPGMHPIPATGTFTQPGSASVERGEGFAPGAPAHRAVPMPVGMAPPDALGRLAVLPDTPSWHEQAQQQALRIEQPVAVAPPGFAFARPLPPTFSPGGGGLGFGQFALPQVPTRIPGLTADIDEQARREVLAELGMA